MFQIARQVARAAVPAFSARGGVAIGRLMAPIAGSPLSRNITTTNLLNDRDLFLERLQFELNDEKANGVQPEFGDKLGDFALNEHTLGQANVSMSATFDDREVTVSLNINECEHIDNTNFFEDEEDADEEDVDTGKEPRFEVAIKNNKTGETMVCKCEAGGEPDESGETRYVFLVAECGLIPKGAKADNVYLSDPNFWDDDLEVALREYLASNGVDDEFVEDLCHYVHDKEYADYVDLLDRMVKFVK